MLRQLRIVVGYGLTILVIGCLDSLSATLSQSLLYGLVCIRAGDRLGLWGANWVVMACVCVHFFANQGYPTNLWEGLLQNISEAMLLALTSVMARRNRNHREALQASQQLVEQTHQALLAHLELARTAQRELLARPSEDLYPYELGIDFEVAVELGGDVFLVCPVAGGLLMFVGDVSGKGPKAALAATSVRVILEDLVQQTHHPEEVLARLQRRFLGHFPEGLFVTAFCAFFHPGSGSLHYANAGHDPPLLKRFGSQLVMELPGGGMPLGVDPAETFTEEVTKFGPGDRLLVYTDGLIDARGPGQQRLGVEPVMQALSGSIGSSQDLATGLVKLAPEPRHDDIMVVVLTEQLALPCEPVALLSKNSATIV